MGNIFIIEDSLDFAKHIENKIQEYIDSHVKKHFDDIVLIHEEFKFFLNQVNSKGSNHHLYVLDVDLNDEVTGFQLANEIRKFDPNGYILFVTSHLELMGQVFLHNLKAISFIYKSDPLIDERIKSVMDQIYHELSLSINQEVAVEALMYQFKSNYYKIKYVDICLIETDPIKRRLQIITQKDEFPCQYKLKDLMVQLPNSFVRVHRSIVVNVRYIKNISTTDGLYSVVLKNGKVLPISRSYIEDVVNAFHDQSFF